MNLLERPSRDIAIPALSLSALRGALREEAGPLAATHALHAAGFRMGEAFYDEFAAGLRSPAGELSEKALWRALSEFFSRRGWGSVTAEKMHPAIGALRSSDWAEADLDSQESQPSCPFTAGFLSTLLTRIAGGPIAVLEVSCRSRGDEECRFVFGSETAIHLLYGRLLDGMALEDALEDL
jgi:predicted hydrocarbon binding protein